ncbi:hypothetical protein BY996DRAFT_6454633 [Phakopsora pachyrhizi]|uniref:Uncharacterized protein n=1 Tax=Phakopsora pachyrhizi TaxID=170000 RepID=A0AAV0ARV0_PHAPC|nr:hypothetical protein BY996DRAFT_6454633 [Phakopsora pachyrhizi]CAH7672078.1 hypothetical protein PPACK8108_LOCUS6860 [Phakopsora pachyrhizi]
MDKSQILKDPEANQKDVFDHFLNLLNKADGIISNAWKKRAEDEVSSESADILALKPTFDQLGKLLEIKEELQRAIQLPICGNYRQFYASASSYNLTKIHIKKTNRKVLELRTKLLECKKTFGDANQPTRINVPAAAQR